MATSLILRFQSATTNWNLPSTPMANQFLHTVNFKQISIEFDADRFELVLFLFCSSKYLDRNVAKSALAGHPKFPQVSG